MQTLVMDMKIRRRHSNGKWYLVRPYLKPNVDDIGNVMNYSIAGKAEEVKLNERQEEVYREMCKEIDRYLGSLIRKKNWFDCEVKDFPSERQVMNLLRGYSGRGIIFPVTGINLIPEYGVSWE